MSKKVDERVVEMRFDNKQFESGVKDTMSTLDKFKQKLQFKDATKGLDDLEKAAKKVDLNPLSKAADTVSMRFSAMQVAGVTAIANLTNSAINAGKNITKALTIDPVITGFQEYETQIGAIQTILANTQKEGTNVERVNAALDELNSYADQTIYNFTEMTRNIGTFTAAGVKLDDSVSAIKGIANLAAVSGSTSQQASTAMYQLSQALAAGKVSLTDWNSVVTAGMGGQVFQDALIRTSENLKTGAKQAIATYGTFRESLTKSGWLTKEVLTETLGQLAGAYSEADLLAKGYSAEQAKEIVKLAETAKSAATDVKTFTQLWDTLKEAVQSGWGQTWRMIVGDFDEAKERISKLYKLFGSIIEKSSNRRNSMLSGALDSNWSKLTTKLNDAGIKTETFQNKIKELAKIHNVNLDEMIKKEGSFEKALKKAFSTGKLDKSILMDAVKSFTGGITESAKAAKTASDQIEKYGEIVNKVIRGDFGNGAERIDKLTKAGYDYATVQNLVNQKLGSSVRHLSSLTEEQIRNADSLADLSDEQLKSKGYTEEQITALKDLKKEADDTGSSIYKLINGFEKPSGVELAWGSVFNILDSITESCKAVKKAWTEIFHPGMTEDQIIAERSAKLYKLLESIHAFTESLKVNENTAQKITRTFKGLFAILDIFKVLISGTFGVAFNIAKGILSAFNLDILDATAYIGDIVVKFRDWIKAALNFKKIFEPLAKLVQGFVKVIRDWFDEFKKSEEVQKLTRKIEEFGEAIHLDSSAADNFKKITEGLSALFTKLSLVLNASLLSGLKVLGAVLNLFGTNLANVAANIIDYLAKSKKWINENILIANTVDEVAKILKTLIDGIKNSVKAFMALEPVQKFIENFKASFKSLFGIFGKLFSGFGIENFANGLAKAFESLQKWIASLNNSDNIGRDIILGLLNGLKAGAGNVISFIIQLGRNLLEAIKGILGIHSPSTEGFDIGKNFILGIINGIKQMISNLLSLLKGIGQKCIDIISNIDFSKIFTLAISAGIIYSGKKIYDLMEKFAAPLEGLGSMFKGIGSMFSGLGKVFTEFAATIKVKKWEIISKSILNFAIAIGILAAALYALSTIEDTTKLWESVLIIGVLASIMLILAAVMEKMSGASASIDKNGLKISGVKTALISIGIALLLMAATVKMIGNLNEDQAKQGFLGLAGLVAAIAIVAIAFGKFVKGKSAQNIDKFGWTLIKMSAAIMLLAMTIKLLGNLSEYEIIRGVVCIAAFCDIMVGLVARTKLAGKKIDKVSGALLKMSAAMLLMVVVIKLIAGMSIGEITKGIICIAAFGGIMVGLVAITKLAGDKDLSKVGSTLLAMSASMVLMALTIKLVAGMSKDEIIKGVACIAAFGAIIIGLVAATRVAGEGELKRVAATILAMSISIGILAAISVLLGLIDIATLTKGVTAVSILGLIMATMVAATRGAENVKGNIIAMTVAIGIMAAAIAALSFIDSSRLAGATAALSMVMGMFALMIKMSEKATGAIGPLLVITAAVAAIGGVIFALASLPDTGAAVSASIAITLLMGSMTAMLYVLGTVSKTATQMLPSVLLGIGGLLLMCIPLMAFIAILKSMNDVKNAEKNAIVLTAFMAAMTALELACIGIGYLIVKSHGLALSGILGLLLMAIPLKSFVNIIKSMDEIQNAEKNVEILIKLMTAITAMLAITALLGPLAIVGEAAIMALIPVITAFGAFTMAVGTLMEKFPALEGFIDKGIPVLSKISNGLGQMIGNFVSGFTQGVTSGLPEIATNLSDFMAKLSPFIEGAKSIDESVISNVKNLASIILILTGAGILNAVSSWMTGGPTITTFGQQIAEFGDYIKQFADSVIGVDIGSVVENAKSLTSMLLTLTGAGILDAATSWLTGGVSIIDFGQQLAEFGPYIKQFADSVAGIDESAVTSAVNAGKMLAEMATALPNSGGVAGFFAGENDIDDFGKQLKKFGKGMADFSSEVDGKVSESSVIAAANAGKMLAEMAAAIPNSGGVAGFFAGENDIDSFGSKLVTFGEGIANFSAAVDGKVNESAVKAAVNAGTIISKLAASLPNSGGAAEFFAGNKDMGKFAEQLPKFGEGISGFSTAISGKTTGLDSAVDSINKLISMLKNVSDVNAGAIALFKKALSDLGNTSINGFIESFTGADAKAKTAVTNFLNGISSAVTNGKESVYTDFVTVGSYLVDGFCDGITANTFKAEAQARAMADAALIAANARLGVDSPSKEFMKVGKFVVAGLANGIIKNVGTANKASVKMANGVLTSTQDALGIHSPSVVFDEKVGRYIVQGVAEGIKKDMSAEEAAEKKAQNIVSAFKNALDDIDLRISNRGKDFDLWQLTDGKTASDVAVVEKQRKQLNDNLWDYNQQVKLTTDKYLMLKETFGENNKYTQEAYGAMRDAQITAANTASSLIAVDDTLLSNTEDRIEKAQTLRQKNKELFDMMESNGTRTHEAYADIFNTGYYKSLIQDATNLRDIAQKEYDKLLADGHNIDSSVVLEAASKLVDRKKDVEQAKQDYLDYVNSTYDDNIQKLEDSASRRDREDEYWEAIYGDDASASKRFAYYAKRDAQNIEEAQSKVKNLKDKYNNYLKEYAELNKVTIDIAKQSDEAKQIAKEVEEAQIAEAQAKQQQRNRQKDYLEQEKEDLKDQYELTSEIADIRYQIWEKTIGRKATDAEKDTMKLAFLTEQLGAQAKLVEMAKDAWENSDADEAQKLEKEYLSAQLELANLQNEVLDIQEENIKRQERALDRQRNASSEYNDYIKKYEKYYLEHGMTREELEKDAKLVSGYDPSKLTEKAISKTNTAIDNVKMNVSNLTKAVGEGIQNGISDVTDNTTSMLKSCAKVLNSEKDTWTKAGAAMVDGLIQGITSKTDSAVKSVTDLVSRMLAAIQDVCENGMDYTPTITPVLDMSSVTTQASRLNSMINGNTSFGLASSVSKLTRDVVTRMKTSQSDDTQNSGTTYSFTQNNYSPKALSSSEIYRQSKNMISRAINKNGRG